MRSVEDRIFIAVVSRRKKICQDSEGYAWKISERLYCGQIIFSGWGNRRWKTSVNRRLDFDYAVVLYTKDDHAVVRKKQCFTARDNVLFEHGIFTGVLSRYRTFALIQKGVRVPSDLSGITYIFFKNEKLQCKSVIGRVFKTKSK